MVSPISSRIYNLEAKARIKSHFKTNVNNNLPWQIENRTKKISGYTADRESSPALFVNAEKNLRAEQVEAFAKKRKIEELNYQAYNAKNDLVNAGIEFVPKSKALLEGTIDMKNVELVMSSKYRRNYSSNIQNHSIRDTYFFEMMNDCVGLFEISKDFYRSHGKQRKIRTSLHKVTSSTSGTSGTGTSLSSSPCDSESEEETTSTAYLMPRLTEKVNVIHSNSGSIYKLLSSSNDDVISLEDALISSNARLIVESKSPFYIVHSNGAFSKLSSISSDELVGASLLNFISNNNDDNSSVELIVSKATELKDDDDQEVQILDKTIKCRITVSCVPMKRGTNENGTNISHFVLDFTKDDSESIKNELNTAKLEETAMITTGPNAANPSFTIG